MNYMNLDQCPTYNSLAKLKPLDMPKTLTPDRIKNYNVDIGGGLFYNWATMPVDEKHLELFSKMTQELQLIEKYRAILSGQIMNTGEKRAVLHHLARGRTLGSDNLVYVDGEEKGSFYSKELEKIASFSNDVRNSKIVSSKAKSFSTVVQIGIGGSDLGPRALYHALEGYCSANNIKALKAHFISNVDPDKLTAAHKSLTFGTVVRVHNLEDNKSVDVTINDRGPFVEGRIIDLTVQGAKELGIYEKGIALVELEILHKPPYPVSNYNRLGDTGYYKIQIGSFSNYQTVQDLYEKLIKEDLIAELELVENNLIRLTIRWIEENRKDEILKTLNKLGIKEPLIRGDVNPLMVD
jgi:hypothetical protein